ncbi:hypothetical protein BH10PSE7_BH10PSE7_35750 [soil metagenome]
MAHHHRLKLSAFRSSAVDRLAVAVTASVVLWLFALWAMDWI